MSDMYWISNIIYFCIYVCFDWNDLDVAVLGCVVPVGLVSIGFYLVLDELLDGVS